MSDPTPKVDVGEDALFNPSELPAEEPDEERRDGDCEGDGESTGGVRSLNKKRIAIIGCVFVGGLLAAAMFGLRGGSSEKKKKQPADAHVSGTSAEREVDRLQDMRSADAGERGEEGQPPDKKKELRERSTRRSKVEQLEEKLEKQKGRPDTGSGGAKSEGPWEKARKQARRRQARAYHNEGFKARRSKVFARMETPTGRRNTDETTRDTDKRESVESMRAKMAQKRKQIERRVRGRSKRRKPLPASATEKKKFLAGNGGGTTRNVHRLKKPASPYTVQAGTLLELVLETGINSELPGMLRGRFARPIYDSRTGEHLLIPAGAVAVGKYNSKVEEGQTRAQVVWTRLILPNGKSLKLGNIPGVDLEGKSGYSDKVDNHWGQVGAGVALTSLLSAGAGAAAGPQSVRSQTPRKGALSAAGQNVAETGEGIVDRELEKKPVIKIRAGMRVGALVHEDLVLEPYQSRELGGSLQQRQGDR